MQLTLIVLKCHGFCASENIIFLSVGTGLKWLKMMISLHLLTSKNTGRMGNECFKQANNLPKAIMEKFAVGPNKWVLLF